MSTELPTSADAAAPDAVAPDAVAPGSAEPESELGEPPPPADGPAPVKSTLIGVTPKSPPEIQAARGVKSSPKRTMSVPLPAGEAGRWRARRRRRAGRQLDAAARSAVEGDRCPCATRAGGAGGRIELVHGRRDVGEQVAVGGGVGRGEREPAEKLREVGHER